MTAAAPPGVVRPELLATIAAGSVTLGVTLSERQLEQLVDYLLLIERWNATYNLTAIRDLRGMAVQHILDCLAVILPLRRKLPDRAGARMLDVGSGAGLPGVVVALAEPELSIDCIDSVGKKAAFITHAAGALGIKNLTATHGRVEHFVATPFDIIASRAYSSISTLLEQTSRILAADGYWMAMKGKLSDDEMGQVPSAAVEVELLEVPGLDAERCVVWISSIGAGANFHGSERSA
ncbi:MAG: 16S rRNA (guanine(527)-N(7))-methyltransferase RsmG [Caldimonas sp.]